MEEEEEEDGDDERCRISYTTHVGEKSRAATVKGRSNKMSKQKMFRVMYRLSGMAK